MQLTLPDDDTPFNQVVEALAAMPRGERNAVIDFVIFWIGLSGELRAMIVKIVRPEMRDVEVARIAGVNRWTLCQWPTYQSIKPTLAHFKHIKSCGCKRRKSARGTWPLIDNPDA